MNARRAVVVGGGLAGIASAIALLDDGVEVTLLEHRARLGGATWSFERNGRSFDNGQHVYLRCCTAYRRLLERLGTAELAPLQHRLDIPVLAPRPGGPPAVSRIRRSGLPSPAHLAPSLLSYRHLEVGDRARLGRAVRALLRASAEDPDLDEETFAQFLERHGQRPAAISRLWDLITLPTTNLHADQVSASLGVKVFRTGLLDEAEAADIGWSTVPLQRLHGDPAADELTQAGATLCFRTKVEALEVGPGGDRPVVDAVRFGGGRIPADAVVLAVPHDQASVLLPAGALRDDVHLDRLGSSPIVDVHVVYDRVVTEYPIAAAIDSPVQFVFDRSDAAGLEPGEGQCLAVSISAADAEHGRRPEDLVATYTEAIAALFPAAAGARVLDAVVSREHHATFRATPGTRRHRPGPATNLANVFLAGAWTDTGWPATMEGAVRSGTRAAWHVKRLLDAAGPAREARVA